MSFCCSECCVEEQEPGILSGPEREIPGGDDTLTAFFHSELRRKRIPAHKVALNFYNESLTFGALQTQSTILANELKARLGTKFVISNPDDDLVISLCLPQSEKMIVLIFAILKIGGTFLPLDPTYPPSVIFEILKSFRPAIVIHEDSMIVPGDSFEELMFFSLEDLWKVVASSAGKEAESIKDEKVMEVIALPQETRANERPAVIIHTTGLNKSPRGVRIGHQPILNRISWTWKNVPFVKTGSCCLNVPVSFVESLQQIFAPLLRGVTLNIYTLPDIHNMSTFIDFLEKDKITRISLSSAILGRFLNECNMIGKDESRMKLKLLKFVACKGEVLTFDLARRFFEAFPADGKLLATMYGYTEIAGDVMCERFKNMAAVRQHYVAGHIVLGKVMDNTKLYIMNVNRELAVNLEQGQICVGGTPLAMGYVNKKSKDFSFINNPFDSTRKYDRMFLTGDYGRYVICRDRQFRLLLEGRGDSFLRHNGYEFVVDEVKDVIKQYDAVEHVNIFVFHRGKADQTILAFILPKSEYLNQLTSSEITEYLKQKIPIFMIPTVNVVQSFPVLITGRLDRQQLLKNYLESRESGFDDWEKFKIKNHEAMNAGKVLLEGMFKFCSIPVKISVKSLNHSFYDLGGLPSNTISLIIHLNKKGYPVTIQDFIGAETIEDFMNLMENRRTLNNFRKGIEDVGILQPRMALAVDSRVPKMYTTKYMEGRHQRETIQVIASSYARHGDLEKIALVSEEDWSSYLTIHWDRILEQQMSFVIAQNQDAKIVAVAYCYDFFTHLDSSQAVGPLKYIVEFGHEVKGQVLSNITEEEAANEIYECFMIGTAAGLSPNEDVRLTVLMINQLLSRATSDGFKSAFIATTNQLIRDLLLEVFEFVLLDDFVVNEYEESGIRPFHLAPGTLTMSSFYKPLKSQNPPSQARNNSS